MTREQIYETCLNEIGRTNFLLLELPTGYGKSKLSIDLVNHLCATTLKDRKVNLLLIVAKKVHKGTWKEEIDKWGGLNVDSITVECYESLKKHTDEDFDIVLFDEVHHIRSETRLELLSMLNYRYLIGLSATIPRKLKKYLKWTYKAHIVSQDLVEAIESEILPEPTIMLMPLHLDNVKRTETIEMFPKAKGNVYYARYEDRFKVKKGRRTILSCTQKQKIQYMNSLILSAKNRYLRVRNKAAENYWLSQAGKRLEILAMYKTDLIKDILEHLKDHRTITFCKTIEQCEQVGSNCIHSRNDKSNEMYESFNRKEIDHITAVNILNENANLVDCKYAVFANLSSSETIILQRLGRSLRHPSPVIIIPYYAGTREDEIAQKMIEGFNKDFVKTIHSISEI